MRGKPISRSKSELWRLLDPAVLAGINNIRHVSWSSSTSDSTLPAAIFHASKPQHVLDLSAIRVYQSCPRQFYYRYVLGLAVRDEREIYMHFHTLVARAVDWLIAQAAQQQFPDWPLVESYLETELQENLPQQHVHAAWYHHQAMVQLQTLWNHIRVNRQDLLNWQTQVDGKFQIGSTSIQFVIDEVFEDERQCSAVIFRTGKPRKSHLAHPLPFLSRQVLQTQTRKPVRVYLHYLSTDTIIEVARDQDNKVLRELNETLSNIDRGYFPPSPDGARAEQVCGGCRYLFLCEGYGTDT
jgi:CRISPR/Cas system-associated exonuclease Cas4 (RecB family)